MPSSRSVGLPKLALIVVGELRPERLKPLTGNWAQLFCLELPVRKIGPEPIVAAVRRLEEWDAVSVEPNLSLRPKLVRKLKGPGPHLGKKGLILRIRAGNEEQHLPHETNAPVVHALDGEVGRKVGLA